MLCVPLSIWFFWVVCNRVVNAWKLKEALRMVAAGNPVDWCSGDWKDHSSVGGEGRDSRSSQARCRLGLHWLGPPFAGRDLRYVAFDSQEHEQIRHWYHFFFSFLFISCILYPSNFEHFRLFDPPIAKAECDTFSDGGQFSVMNSPFRNKFFRIRSAACRPFYWKGQTLGGNYGEGLRLWYLAGAYYLSTQGLRRCSVGHPQRERHWVRHGGIRRRRHPIRTHASAVQQVRWDCTEGQRRRWVKDNQQHLQAHFPSCETNAKLINHSVNDPTVILVCLCVLVQDWKGGGFKIQVPHLQRPFYREVHVSPTWWSNKSGRFETNCGDFLSLILCHYSAHFLCLDTM